MRTVADIAKAMRAAFPANRAQQRKEARERSWNAKTESAMSYYFTKIQLMRQAFGQTYDESALAQDVAGGLEPTLRAYIRLPSHAPTLALLQESIAEWEPTWREVYKVVLQTVDVNPAPAAKSASSAVAVTGIASVSSPPARPPRSEQRNSPVVVKPIATTSSAPALTPMASLSETYDPTRVIPATGDQPRLYRRPNSTRVMRLARNCSKCSGQHFDFEHEHLQRSGLLQTLDVLTEDYPEDEAETLGLDPF
ncbi:hypothetical protein CF326_g7438 [Tilletia indica]|nr:hypothetical protein CF326_g7438 [Tilletia indica]